MLKQLSRPVLLAAGIALAMVVGLVAVLVSTADSDGGDWRSTCATAPSPAATGAADAVTAARKALLDQGNEPLLGVEIVDLDECAVRASWKADQPQPAASVVKLLIALDFLDRSGIPADDDATALHTMLAASDDRIAGRFWQQLGGPQLVRRQSAKLGLTRTRPPEDAGQWGSTRISPADVITIYRHITSELDDERRTVITDALADAPQHAADGFDQHFGIPRAVPDGEWAIKQGWGSSAGRRVLNTTGLVRAGGHTYAVAVLASWTATVDWPTATAALTRATAALTDALPDD